MSGGALQCWGHNGSGQLGDNSTVESHLPVDVVGLSSDVIAVAAGDLNSCAITTGGALRCWGNNAAGQLGNNSTNDSHAPVDVVGLSSGVLSVAVSDALTCAVTSAGAVKCWGTNLFGQLGNNSTMQSQVPVDVAGLSSGVTALAVGELHACAVTSSGDIKCWGWNAYGQLGDGSLTDSHVPVDVIGF